MVFGQLPVLHHPDRFHRAGLWPVALVDDLRRGDRHPGRHLLHGLPRESGANVRAASDDPVAGPVRVPRSHRRPVCRVVHLHGVQRCRSGAVGRRTAWDVRLERQRDRRRGDGRRRSAGDLRPRLGAPGLSVAALHPAAAGGHHHDRRAHGSCGPWYGPHALRLQLDRLHGSVLRRRGLQHHLRGLCVRLLALSAAQHAQGQDHRVCVRRCGDSGYLADLAGRLAGDPAGRDRRAGRPQDGRQQRVRSSRISDGPPVGDRPGGDHGDERLWRHVDDPGRRRFVPQGHSDPGSQDSHHPRS